MFCAYFIIAPVIGKMSKRIVCCHLPMEEVGVQFGANLAWLLLGVQGFFLLKKVLLASCPKFLICQNRSTNYIKSRVTAL